jgi:hypothetical protein
MKHRQFSIVFHNVDEKKTQDTLKQYVAKAKEYVMSVEAYPQGEGFHAHLFIQYNNQRSFFSVLKELEILKKKIICPRPEDCIYDWGRVQLDVMKGRFSQAEAYLQGETKDKPIGEVLHGVVKPCFRRHRFTGTIGDYKCVEEYCVRCDSAICWGCCPGCRWCDETILEEWEGQRKEYIKGLEKQRDHIKKKKNFRPRPNNFFG